jgi:hypothetical protein
METKIKIRFGLGYCEYNINAGEWIPLPWGEIEFKEFIKVIGHLYQSRGGHWIWDFPPQAIIGYGRFNPTALFYFTGKVKVKYDKVLFEENGGKIKFFNGMRIGEKKVIIFDGKIIPSEIFRIENVVRKYFNEQFIFSVRQYCLSNNVKNFYRQGHLDVFPLFIREDWDNLSQFISKKLDEVIENGKIKNNWDYEFVNRRKIFNHQFFGNIKIYWLGEDYWAIRLINGGEAYIVSPDHIQEPVILYSKKDAWFIAEHPLPSSNNTD